MNDSTSQKSPARKPQYTFIDLFAGLGGFHLALSRLGCKCVFASELKEDLIEQYKRNFPDVRIVGDITKISPAEIPPHEILCAGFPCQPFSQAGKRQGFNDDRGNLFNYIYAILKEHRPQFVILENVPNLIGHDGGNTWRVIKGKLEEFYDVAFKVLSPHQFGIPQHRNRIYIVCVDKKRGDLGFFNFPEPELKKCDINDVIDSSDENYTPLKHETREQLYVWEDFIKETVAHNKPLPRFPVWAMEFGADYEYDTAPAFQNLEQLRGKKGHLGRAICGDTIDECLKCLPVYARTGRNRVFPTWKRKYISQNRAFYNENKAWLDPWIDRIRSYDNSHQKFEWNCGDKASPTLRDKIIQFRASGIRVKLPTFIPALNLVGTQTPIFFNVPLPPNSVRYDEPHFGRYMTLKEAARVQGMEDLRFDKLTKNRAYAALGNAVNVVVVEKIMKNLLENDR